MSKTYKGWELLKEIEEGNIKEGTKIKVRPFEGCEDIYKYNGDDFINEYNEELMTSEHSIGSLSASDFEIIENQEEINIQDIKEINHYSVFSVVDGLTIENTDAELATISVTVNELIQAVKQLDNKIKENK